MSSTGDVEEIHHHRTIDIDRVPLPPGENMTPPVPDTPVDDHLATMAPDVSRDGAHHNRAAPSGPPAVVCGECEKEAATFECLDCGGEWYCRPCAIIVHNKGRRKAHTNFKEHPVCDICRSQLATLQCDKCDEYYCTTRCAYGAHDGSPRGSSKKRTHQWGSVPKEGMPVARPPHLEHAVDTRGGRNSFGIALSDLTLARYDGGEEGYDGPGFDMESGNGGGHGNHHHHDEYLAEMTGDDIPLGRGSQTPADNGRASNTPGPAAAEGAAVRGDSALAASLGQQQQQGGGALTASASGTLTISSPTRPGADTIRTATGALVVMNPEEKVQAGKSTEAHFAADSPLTNAKRSREEITAAIVARNLPAPDLDEVVTLVTSARDVLEGSNNSGLASSSNKQGAAGGVGHQQGSLTSVAGGKSAQLIVEDGFNLKPVVDPPPERLLLAGITDKLEAESKARNAALAKKIAESTGKTKPLVDKIHGWRRWDTIRAEPAMFGQHPTPLMVNRPLPPLLPAIADVNADPEQDPADATGFTSYVPFFEKSCHDESFLLAVSALLASNGYQHVKPVKQEDVDAEAGVFTPRIKGGPVINVVAPGFDAPANDNRQQKKKDMEKADAAAPCPIGNIFLTAFASCERLQELGVATFRFFKPTSGLEMRLGAERQLVAHRSPHKATNGVVPPIVEAVEHFVTVDTLFPVNEDGRPSFGRTDVPDEFWLTLLEKAYATQAGANNSSPVGGLAALVGGSPINPLFALCGGEPTQLQWGLQALDSSAFTSTSPEQSMNPGPAAADGMPPASNNAATAAATTAGSDSSPLALRQRTISLVWWYLQIATQYNLPMCVTKRLCKTETDTENSKTTWHRLESGLDEVEDFEWVNGDVVFFAVNHQVDRNLLDAQQYLDEDDERSSSKSGMSGTFSQSMNASKISHVTGFTGLGGAVASQKEEHRLVKLRQLYNTARENEVIPAADGSSSSKSQQYALPLWHDGSNKWSDIVSKVSGTSGVAAFAQRRAQQAEERMARSTAGGRSSSGIVPSGSSASGAGRAPAGAGGSIRGYAESALSRRDQMSQVGGPTQAGGAGAPGQTMWSKSTRKALQHQVADERLTWMDVETFAQKYNTILVAQNLPQHKHHSFFGAIDMRVPESEIARVLPHYLVVVEKRELENSDEADDRKWAEGIDPAFASIKSVLKPPRSMCDDLGFDKNETDDDAEDGKAGDDTASVASSQVSISESLADMGTMASRRSLVLRVTLTQPTTRVDPHLIASSANEAVKAAVASGEMEGSSATSIGAGMEETQDMLEKLSQFKAVLQPEELTLYAFRVSTPSRQEVTKGAGARGEVVYSLPVHTRCLVNEVEDPIAIGQVPQGLAQATFEVEAPVGVYNFVVAPTRGMGRADLSNDCVSMAHFSMHICAVRNGENFEVKAGKV